MTCRVVTRLFLEHSKKFVIIDVRSPGEYNHGHISGAVNIPLFDDEERTKIGILYKKNGEKETILAGLEIAGKKTRIIAEKALKVAKDNKVLLHCWRGGMRSESIAWLLETVGIHSYILKGGYKSYRQFIRKYFAKNLKFCILGGMTGSGKTDILQILENKGYQILDLEKIARHKGSVFGSLGEDPQKSNEQFENDLFTDLFALDSTKTIWIEDESRNIGYNVIPPEFFKTMSRSPVIVLNIEKELRLNNLVGKYGKFQDEDLIYCLNKISKRLGGLNTKKAILALTEGKPELTARIVLEYYDKFYHYSLSRKQQKKVFHINSRSINPERNVQIITSFAINNKLCTLPYRPV